jgi:hypothetical protein
MSLITSPSQSYNRTLYYTRYNKKKRKKTPHNQALALVSSIADLVDNKAMLLELFKR